MDLVESNISNNRLGSYSKSKFPTIIIVFFFTIYFLNTLGLYNIKIGQVLLLLVGCLGYFYTLKRNVSKNNLKFLSVIWMSTILGLFSYFMNNNANLVEYLWPIAYGGASIILLNFNIQNKPISIMYYIVCLYYIYAMLSNQIPEDLSGHTSRNTLSITILVFFVLLSIIRYKQNIRMSPILAYLGLAIAFWAVGRSGIITFVILSLGFTIFSFNGKMVEKMKSYKFITLIILIMGLLYLFRDLLIYPAVAYYNRWGFESGRTVIWQSYFQGITESPLYLIFGYPLKNNSIFTYFGFNLHNSFLSLHARYGIIVLAFMSLKLFQKTFIYARKKKTLYFILMVAIIFRINFDLAAFNGILDVFIYYFIFEEMFNKESWRLG